MKTEKKSTKSLGVHVGSSLILVAFVLLCLVAFSALSYASAMSDYRLSLQTAQRKQDYYSACSRAEIKISEIDYTLNQLSEHTSDHEYFDEIENYYSQYDSYLFSHASDCPTLSFTEPISSNEQLNVVLRLLPHNSSTGSKFEIQSYQSEVTSNYSEDINLISFN